MKRSYLIGVVVALVLVAGYFIYQRTRQEVVAADLIALFSDDARVDKRSALPREAAYQVGNQTIKGELKPAIFMHPTSRLTYRGVLIPGSGSLRVFLAIKEDAWDKPSDGVLFRFGVSDGREYQELLNQHLDPAHIDGDRRWIEKEINLSAYAGQHVDLIFNTNTSVPGRGDDAGYDFALWGAPAIIAKQ